MLAGCLGKSVKEAIEKRRSVRAFAPEALSESQIRELLEAARLAPSSLNSQPWRFKVVSDKAGKEWLASKEASRNQQWLASAAAIFICCADVSGYVKDSQASVFSYEQAGGMDPEVMSGIKDYLAREETAAASAKFAASAMNCALAVGFMMLRAMEIGLGSCWVGMFDEARIKERFGLGADIRVVSLLAVGKPAEGAPSERKRKSVEDIVLP